MKIIVLILLPVLVVWGIARGGEWVYAKVVEGRYQDWERSVERDPDGVRIGCREFTIGEGKTALLLIHGFGDSPALFTQMASILAHRGYTCRAARLPGFAEPMERYQKTDRGQWMKNIRSEIAVLRKTHDSVWVIGHSTGATLGIQTVLNDVDAVEGLILLAPLLQVSSKRSPILTSEQWFRISRPLLHRTQFLETAFPVDADDPVAKGYAYRDQFVPVPVYDELFALMAGVRDQGKKVLVPVMMVLAEQDQVVDNEAAHKFWETLPPVRQRLIVQPDAGHVVPIDTGWKRLVEEIDAFIQST